MAYVSFNPWLQEINATFPEMEDTALWKIVGEAGESFSHWRSVSVDDRCSRLLALGDNLRQRRSDLADLMASEMGKPISQGAAEIDKCVLACRWYAENAMTLLQPDRRLSSARESRIFYAPQGIILGIMPWNFPFWQVFRFIVPALAGGNAALLKHASNVPLCALAIEEAVMASGFPHGLFRTIFPSRKQVSLLIASQSVRGVSLTGSNAAGEEIASVAGRNLKKVVMELGGSDPFIIFHDATLDRAVEAVIISRFQNCGQSCIAAKRVLVHTDIYDTFREKLLEKVALLKTGDPLDASTDIGPMVNEKAADDLERQLNETLAAGAKLLCGGRNRSAGPSFFLPTVVEQVPLTAPVACEEVFGPLLPLFRFREAAEAVRMANDTSYGLGATIWTTDEDLAADIARQIDAGTIAVNGYVKSEPGLPFGGVRDSGFGRELGAEGLREFLNIKTINIF
jgi:succinate-semialdehyde dehydrogenase/glutarate-semialdehyde dehydrogenase